MSQRASALAKARYVDRFGRMRNANLEFSTSPLSIGVWYVMILLCAGHIGFAVVDQVKFCTYGNRPNVRNTMSTF